MLHVFSPTGAAAVQHPALEKARLGLLLVTEALTAWIDEAQATDHWISDSLWTTANAIYFTAQVLEAHLADFLPPVDAGLANAPTVGEFVARKLRK